MKCPPKADILILKKKKGSQAARSHRPKFETCRRGPMPNGMFIVTSFTLILNKESGVFSVVSDETVNCPLCDGSLFYRNNRLRCRKSLIGEISRLLLRRFLCERCKKLHTEIPDIIQPYKHYDSEAIQCVLDDSEESSTCVADNSTMRRWKKNFEEAEADINQRITSVSVQELDAKAPLIASSNPFMFIRASQLYWFAFVMKLLINNGHKLCTRFAFCPPYPSATVESESKMTAGGGRKSDKTIENSS